MSFTFMGHPAVRVLAITIGGASIHCVVVDPSSDPTGTVTSDGGDDAPSTSDSGEDSTGSMQSGTDATSGDDEPQSTSGESAGESPEDSGDEDTSAETGAVDPDSILFAADFDDARFPEYGFSFEAMTAGHSSRMAVVGEGPHGEDVCEYELLPNPEPVQPYIGWSRQELPATPMGAARYIRLLLFIDSPCDAIGTFDVWTDKFIILGDGVPDPWGGVGRVIIGLGDPHDGAVRTTIARNIDGAEHGTEQLTLTCGEWHWLQWEVRSSSTLDSDDGGFKVWAGADNESYETPTQVSPGFPLVSEIDESPGNVWNNIGLGSFVNTSLASGTMRFRFAAFEYGTEFDPSWHE